jgi:signal transduction histidine kinase
MASPDEDLSARLPRGVLSDLGGWTLYQSFRVFSWPWLLRRLAVFGPLALLAGCVFAAWHASGMGTWDDWPGLAWRAALAALVAVAAGPLLATLVRHLRPAAAIERLLVILAVLAGLVAAYAALAWASAYHDALMRAHRGQTMTVGLFGRALSRFFAASVDASWLVFLVAGGGLAIFYYLGERRRIAQHEAGQQLERLRAERDAAETRLAVLQAQVEPHFLFNTLASIRSLVATEPARAAQTIEALGDYLRATLPRLRGGRAEENNLGEQLEICAGYLDLMRVRMADRLEVRIEADAAARALPFPPLILLTLVENAVTHGIEPKRGPGRIAIAAAVEDDMLIVVVEDDGAGLAPGTSAGLGLSNVRAQLLGLYGERAALDVASRPDGGVSARIRIPAAAS